MENKMIEKINKELKKLDERFKKTQKYDDVKNAYIDGLIDMLSIVTSKEYTVSKDCKLQEVK